MTFTDAKLLSISIHVIAVRARVYDVAQARTTRASLTGHTCACKMQPILISLLLIQEHLSRPMGKPTISIGENKDADQLRGNRETDQRLCFRFSDTIPLLLKSKISSFWLFSVLVQVGLCRTWSETTLLDFPRGGSICLSNRREMCTHYW